LPPPRNPRIPPRAPCTLLPASPDAHAMAQWRSVPVLDLTYLPWESSFRPEAPVEFAASNYAIPFALAGLYLVGVFGGRRVMESRAAFDLKLPLALWNMLLGTFSFIGMVRTVPHLLYNLGELSFYDTVCTKPSESWGVGAPGLWVMLFIFSKIPELVDTAFIVLRKRPVIFLHWYHHLTVMLYCWNAYAVQAGSGLYFVAMNYAVHSVMYSYYACSAFGVVPKGFPAWIITVGQIAQMIIGTFVCCATWYYRLKGTPCYQDDTNMVCAAVMYASYLALFVKFFYDRFVAPKKSKKA